MRAGQGSNHMVFTNGSETEIVPRHKEVNELLAKSHHQAPGTEISPRYLESERRKDKMLADGMPYEKVAKYSKLILEELKALDTKKPA